MNFDVQDLILLDTIERSGSFSAAADKLLRTRSAITQHVQKLEEQVGFQIFDRSHYRPIFTPEGRLFLERGLPLLRNLERLKADIQHIKQGWESEFFIALDDVFDVDNLFFLLEEFREVAPSVTIHISREVLGGCWDSLLTNRASLAIGATGDPPPALPCGQSTLGTVDFVFAVAKDHPLTRCSGPITPEDLEPFPAVVVSDTSQLITKRSSGLMLHRQSLIVPTMDAKIKAQIRGLGVGFLPYPRIKPLLQTGELVALTLSPPTQRKAIFKIAWQTNANSPALAWFLEAFKSETVLNRILGSS